MPNYDIDNRRLSEHTKIYRSGGACIGCRVITYIIVGLGKQDPTYTSYAGNPEKETGEEGTRRDEEAFLP